jgi:hypothetical protein
MMQLYDNFWMKYDSLTYCKPGLTRVQTTMRRAELAGAWNDSRGE